MYRPLLLLFSSFLLFSSCQKEDKTTRPNIVIINVDDLGWRDLGYQGSKFYETPNIDKLSEQGMVFTNGYASASNCAPSRASMMTGLWTPRHGIYTVASSKRGKSEYRKLIPVENTTILAEDHVTLAEILKENGYTTCHAGKWHLTENPKTRGFDVNIGGGLNGHPKSYYPPYRNVDLEAPNKEYLTDLIMTKSLDFIKTVKTPFLLNYAPYAVHTPIQPVVGLKNKYAAKTEWNGQNNVDYATMIENLDRNIGLLISVLNEMNLMNNTFIVFTSDNGGLYGITKQLPLRAGKGSYYEGGIRVPFYFVWKGKISSDSQNDTPITNLDLFPTILQVAGIEQMEYAFDGRSLLPLLKGQDDFDRRPLFWHFPIYLQAYNVRDNQNRDSLFRTRPGSVIRYGDWKLHHYFENDEIELYNLEEDVSEAHNIAKEHPEKTDELYSLLSKWRNEVKAPVPKDPNPNFKY